MRLRYLCAALLAGIMAATAFTDSTSTTSESAASREERSRPSDRDDIAAIGASGNDEDRTGPNQAHKMTVSRFFKEVLLHDAETHSTFLNGWSNDLNKLVVEKTTPEEIYEAFVRDVTEPLLTSHAWKRWAFYASKYCVQHNINPHKYIVEVMSDHYGAGRFSEILAVPVESPIVKKLIALLREVQILLWLRERYTLEQVFSVLQVNEVWANNIFESPRFATWTRYLQRVYNSIYKKNPVGTEVYGLWGFIKFDELLMMPMIPKNAQHSKSARYLQVFKSIGLSKKALPSQFVSLMLKVVETDEEKFTMLFTYESTRDFWMDYVKEFNKQYPHHTTSLCKTLNSIYDLPELFTMLLAAVKSPLDERSGMALWYFTLQFAEWKASRVNHIADIMPDRYNIPSEIPPVITVTWQAYIKFLHKFRLSKADFIVSTV